MRSFVRGFSTNTQPEYIDWTVGANKFAEENGLRIVGFRESPVNPQYVNVIFEDFPEQGRSPSVEKAVPTNFVVGDIVVVEHTGVAYKVCEVDEKESIVNVGGKWLKFVAVRHATKEELKMIIYQISKVMYGDGLCTSVKLK